MGKQITPENVSEILDSELPDGCTGSARVRNDGLEIRREENADWLYYGPVDDPAAVRAAIDEWWNLPR